MFLRLIVLTALVAELSFCHKPNSVDEARLNELRDLEERAAQRDAEAKATQLDADRQKLADDQAALERERQQLATEREAARSDPQQQARLQENERRLEQLEAQQRAAQERADADERAVQAARDAREAKRAATTRNLDYFYTALDQQGDWMETGSYGYVWQPREARSPDWRPYTDGTWVYTDYGWTWKGNEPFGWATYHYGRWTRLQGRGWVWVPGSEWAPAWVSWRKSPQYVGWAPLPPEAYARNGFDAAADNYYDIGPASYNFVPVRSLGEPTYRGIIVEPQRNFTIITETTNVTRMHYASYGRETVYYNHGPDIDQLSGFSARPIPRYRLERESSVERNGAGNAVSGNVLRLLAPPIAAAARPAVAPAKVAEHLGSVPVERGWGTSNNPNAEAFRNKSREEAAQAEQRSRQAPVALATPRPFLATGTATPHPLSGHFGGGPAAKPFGTGGSPAAPSLLGTSAGLSHEPAKMAAPAPAGEPTRPIKSPGANAFTAPPPSSAALPNSPPSPAPTHPQPHANGTPASKPGKFPPAAPQGAEKMAEPTLATPHPVRTTEPPLATPHLKKGGFPESNSGLGTSATPRASTELLPKANPPSVPHATPPASLPMERPRKATGSDGVPVIPAATPHRGPANAEGGPEPRKTVPPEGSKPSAASPTASPTPKKKKE